MHLCIDPKGLAVHPNQLQLLTNKNAALKWNHGFKFGEYFHVALSTPITTLNCSVTRKTSSVCGPSLTYNGIQPRQKTRSPCSFPIHNIVDTTLRPVDFVVSACITVFTFSAGHEQIVAAKPATAEAGTAATTWLSVFIATIACFFAAS